jgi:RNA polymerase sigma-70 factor (ECF subfamily)
MNFDDLPDKELFRLCAEGDPAAWDFFVEKYSKLVYNSIHATLRKYSSDFLREDVEDIYSQVFLSLLDEDYRRLKQFRGDRNSSAAIWLSVMAMNRTVNFISRTRTHISLDDESDTSKTIRFQKRSHQPSVLEQLTEAQEIKILNLVIENLKPQEQLIIKYHLEGLSSKEIGGIVGKTQNAVDSLLSRTRKKLKDILDTL